MLLEAGFKFRRAMERGLSGEPGGYFTVCLREFHKCGISLDEKDKNDINKFIKRYKKKRQ